MAGEQEGGARARTDCLSCRVTGTAVCWCLSAYLAAHEYAKPSASPMQRRLTMAMVAGFAVMGVARALT